MLSLIVVKEFLDTKVGRMLAIGAIVLVAFGVWLFAHDRKVAGKAVQKIERATDNAITLGNSGADRSRSGRVRGGRIDPTTSND